MSSLGILPAAGKAARFGGLLKELLPTQTGEALLHAAYRRVCHCDQKVVLTTPEKVMLHASAAPHALFKLQFTGELFEAVLLALALEADEYYFTMPDTVYEGTWPELTAPLMLGMFRTYEPARYGVLHGNRIHDKAQWPQTDTFRLAWGALAWTREVRDYWLAQQRTLKTFDAALNAAMDKFGYACFELSDYHDFADMAHYQAYLCSPLTPKPMA